ncbi:MAG: YbjN domain-containing protein [Propionibacteriaceae bacterium]|jgi:hypothetical protein|nr:YbjN domain-containing protein [Propionibacteriaceae bacterium]
MASDDFDFDRSVEQAWRRFTLRLADVLSMMDETEPLTLLPFDHDGEWYIRFGLETRGRLTARVPLTGRTRLTPAQIGRLTGFGWERSGADCRLTVDQDQCARLAGAAVTVLREIFLVQHPVFLDSDVLAEILQEPAVADTPGIAAEENLSQGPLDDEHLAAAVAEELAQVYGAPPVRDQDGDFAVRVGSTMIFIRIPPDGREVRLFSVLVHDVTGRSRAAEVLNDVNAHARWVRFSLVRDKIMATMSILASPFVPAHLRQAITEMTNVADGVDDLLAASLNGTTTFPAEI